MKDKILYIITTKYRQLIRILDELKLPTKSLYKYYFKFVNNLLKKDFENVDKLMSPKLENLNCTKLKSEYSKKIWVMWWQGLDEAPEIVKSCINRMKKIFGERKVIVVDKSNYKRYTNLSVELQEKYNQKEIPFPFWSDIIRFNLLKNNGGVWIDSTVLLSNKILDLNIQEEKFFSINTGKNYRFISDGKWTGWMIGGEKNLALFSYVDLFYQLYYKNHNKIIDYYLLDYVIFHYYNNNEKFKKIVDNQEKKWKNFEFINNLFKPFSKNLIIKFHNNIEFSVQKLTYKNKMPRRLNKNALYNFIIKEKI